MDLLSWKNRLFGRPKTETTLLSILSIDLILRNVIQHLRWEDLRNLRSVNNAFNHIILSETNFISITVMQLDVRVFCYPHFFSMLMSFQPQHIAIFPIKLGYGSKESIMLERSKLACAEVTKRVCTLVPGCNSLEIWNRSQRSWTKNSDIIHYSSKDEDSMETIHVPHIPTVLCAVKSLEELVLVVGGELFLKKLTDEEADSVTDTLTTIRFRRDNNDHTTRTYLPKFFLKLTGLKVITGLGYSSEQNLRLQTILANNSKTLIQVGSLFTDTYNYKNYLSSTQLPFLRSLSITTKLHSLFEQDSRSLFNFLDNHQASLQELDIFFDLAHDRIDAHEVCIIIDQLKATLDMISKYQKQITKVKLRLTHTAFTEHYNLEILQLISQLPLQKLDVGLTQLQPTGRKARESWNGTNRISSLFPPSLKSLTLEGDILSVIQTQESDQDPLGLAKVPLLTELKLTKMGAVDGALIRSILQNACRLKQLTLTNLTLQEPETAFFAPKENVPLNTPLLLNLQDLQYLELGIRNSDIALYTDGIRCKNLRILDSWGGADVAGTQQSRVILELLKNNPSLVHVRIPTDKYQKSNFQSLKKKYPNVKSINDDPYYWLTD